MLRVSQVPSLGSATANEAFFSSLIESSIPAKAGVTFPSTIAALCSNAAILVRILKPRVEWGTDL